MIDKNNVVPCVDWFRGIVPIDDVREFCVHLEQIDARLKLDNFVYDGRSMLNFKKRFCHIDVPSLTFAFNPVDELDDTCLFANPNHNNKHILFSLSGDAIRYLGHESLKTLLFWLHSVGVKTTRFDIALDFYNPDDDIVWIMLEGCKNFIAPSKLALTVNSKLKRDPVNWKCYINRYVDGTESYGYDIGNHGSDHGMFRIYDKKYETLYGRNRSRSQEMLNGRDFWYRAELELHRSPCVEWAQRALDYLIQSDFNLYAVFGQAISEFISFEFIIDTQARKFTDSETWNQFINDLITNIHFV